jgi:UPF0755 protein
MIRKIIVFILIIILFLTGWLIMSPSTSFQDNRIFIYIHTGKTEKEDVLTALRSNHQLNRIWMIEWVGDLIGLWSDIRPGKYEIKKGAGVLTIIRMLRNHQQTPVNLVITKLRIPQQLASLIGKKFECDSASFMVYANEQKNLESYEVNDDILLFIVHPNTYTYYWNADPETIINKLYEYHQRFWNEDRKAKAAQLGLTPLQVTALASIVEEETLVNEEKPIIAKVYLNRLKKDMALGADPTVKFATGDFTLRRILLKHIKETAQSPYNTYMNKGLPPGPICTPQDATIDAVLNPDQNDYLFFCAAPGFTGRHYFAKTDQEHVKNARIYQQWLNEQGIR